jgi:hypothetical protein
MPLDAAQTAFLRRLARRTWAYFDHFAGPTRHWLPPDNVQESPAPAVAERTSPTNIGLALASALAACDFGYLSPGRSCSAPRAPWTRWSGWNAIAAISTTGTTPAP